MRTEVRACIKKEVMRLKNETIISSEDATLIDSIERLILYDETMK